MTRREQVIMLLRSRGAWHPARGRVEAPGAVPGFVHRLTVRQSCEDCLSNGFVSRDCATCHGKGHIETVRERDPYAVEKVQPYGIDPTKHDRRHDLDAQIARLERQTAAPKSEADLLAEANLSPYPWERDRERHYRNGSYRELEAALEWLAGKHPAARALVGWVYESGADRLGVLHPSVLDAAEAAVDVLADRMPEEIRVPPWLKPKHPAQERRDRRNAA